MEQRSADVAQVVFAEIGGSMTEKDIIKALECCRDAEDGKSCSSCPFNGNADCVTDLMRSAASIIKLQQQAVEDSVDQFQKAKIDNMALQTAAKFHFTLEKLVDKINDVMKQSIYHGGDTGGSYESNWDGLIGSVDSLLYLIDEEKKLVFVHDRSEMPKIVFKK